MFQLYDISSSRVSVREGLMLNVEKKKLYSRVHNEIDITYTRRKNPFCKTYIQTL